MTHIPIGNNPHLSPNMRLLARPEYASLQMATGYNMGLTAEKLAEDDGFSRVEMDTYSAGSHTKAAKSVDEGWFKGELMPMKVEVGGAEKMIDVDQSIRRDTTVEQLSKLQPSFKEGGLITPGNSSPLNAGASLVALMSAEKVREYAVKPLARIVSFGWAGVEPSVMGKGPVPASRKALEHAGMRVDQMDLWEINEAFAVVALYAIRELGLDPARINIHGGAIAIGHPLGASGARVLGTLARELQSTGKEFGVATLCVGGGQGFATVLQRV